MKELIEIFKKGIKVVLPSHLFSPSNAETIDIRKVCEIEKNTDEESLIFEIKAGEGEAFRFIKYAIYTDAEDQNDIEFFPRINGKRILRLHGTPQGSGSYKLGLGLAPDLSNYALINCDILLKPNQKLTWHVVNKNDVSVPMGVRMVGHVDNLNKRDEGLFR